MGAQPCLACISETQLCHHSAGPSNPAFAAPHPSWESGAPDLYRSGLHHETQPITLPHDISNLDVQEERAAREAAESQAGSVAAEAERQAEQLQREAEQKLRDEVAQRHAIEALLETARSELQV